MQRRGSSSTYFLKRKKPGMPAAMAMAPRRTSEMRAAGVSAMRERALYLLPTPLRHGAAGGWLPYAPLGLLRSSSRGHTGAGPARAPVSEGAGIRGVGARESY